MGMTDFLFTSESVTEGHPDKLCDQVSDAVLDACLAQDTRSRVACEAATKTGFVMLLGEITTKATINFDELVRKVESPGREAAPECGVGQLPVVPAGSLIRQVWHTCETLAG